MWLIKGKMKQGTIEMNKKRRRQMELLMSLS